MPNISSCELHDEDEKSSEEEEEAEAGSDSNYIDLQLAAVF